MPIPSVEELTSPITVQLIKHIRSQGDIRLSDSQLMQKKPAELKFSERPNWVQILAGTQSDIYKDLQYGRFYQKYQIDEGFIEATFPDQIIMTPARWAANVMAALGEPGAGVV